MFFEKRTSDTDKLNPQHRVEDKCYENHGWNFNTVEPPSTNGHPSERATFSVRPQKCVPTLFAKILEVMIKIKCLVGKKI